MQRVSANHHVKGVVSKTGFNAVGDDEIHIGNALEKWPGFFDHLKGHIQSRDPGYVWPQKNRHGAGARAQVQRGLKRGRIQYFFDFIILPFIG